MYNYYTYEKNNKINSFKNINLFHNENAISNNLPKSTKNKDLKELNNINLHINNTSLRNISKEKKMIDNHYKRINKTIMNIASNPNQFLIHEHNNLIVNPREKFMKEKNNFTIYKHTPFKIHNYVNQAHKAVWDLLPDDHNKIYEKKLKHNENIKIKELISKNILLKDNSCYKDDFNNSKFVKTDNNFNVSNTEDNSNFYLTSYDINNNTSRSNNIHNNKLNFTGFTNSKYKRKSKKSEEREKAFKNFAKNSYAISFDSNNNNKIKYNYNNKYNKAPFKSIMTLALNPSNLSSYNLDILKKTKDILNNENNSKYKLNIPNDVNQLSVTELQTLKKLKEKIDIKKEILYINKLNKKNDYSNIKSKIDTNIDKNNHQNLESTSKNNIISNATVNNNKNNIINKKIINNSQIDNSYIKNLNTNQYIINELEKQVLLNFVASEDKNEMLNTNPSFFPANSKENMYNNTSSNIYAKDDKENFKKKLDLARKLAFNDKSNLSTTSTSFLHKLKSKAFKMRRASNVLNPVDYFIKFSKNTAEENNKIDKKKNDEDIWINGKVYNKNNIQGISKELIKVCKISQSKYKQN